MLIAPRFDDRTQAIRIVLQEMQNLSNDGPAIHLGSRAILVEIDVQLPKDGQCFLNVSRQIVMDTKVCSKRKHPVSGHPGDMPHEIPGRLDSSERLDMRSQFLKNDRCRCLIVLSIDMKKRAVVSLDRLAVIERKMRERTMQWQHRSHQHHVILTGGCIQKETARDVGCRLDDEVVAAEHGARHLRLNQLEYPA